MSKTVNQVTTSETPLNKKTRKSLVLTKYSPLEGPAKKRQRIRQASLTNVDFSSIPSPYRPAVTPKSFEPIVSTVEIEDEPEEVEEGDTIEETSEIDISSIIDEAQNVRSKESDKPVKSFVNPYERIASKSTSRSTPKIKKIEQKPESLVKTLEKTLPEKEKKPLYETDPEILFQTVKPASQASQSNNKYKPTRSSSLRQVVYPNSTLPTKATKTDTNTTSVIENTRKSFTWEVPEFVEDIIEEVEQPSDSNKFTYTIPNQGTSDDVPEPASKPFTFSFDSSKPAAASTPISSASPSLNDNSTKATEQADKPLFSFGKPAPTLNGTESKPFMFGATLPSNTASTPISFSSPSAPSENNQANPEFSNLKPNTPSFVFSKTADTPAQSVTKPFSFGNNSTYQDTSTTKETSEQPAFTFSKSSDTANKGANVPSLSSSGNASNSDTSEKTNNTGPVFVFQPTAGKSDTSFKVNGSTPKPVPGLSGPTFTFKPTEKASDSDSAFKFKAADSSSSTPSFGFSNQTQENASNEKPASTPLFGFSSAKDASNGNESESKPFSFANSSAQGTASTDAPKFNFSNNNNGSEGFKFDSTASSMASGSSLFGSKKPIESENDSTGKPFTFASHQPSANDVKTGNQATPPFKFNSPTTESQQTPKKSTKEQPEFSFGTPATASGFSFSKPTSEANVPTIEPIKDSNDSIPSFNLTSRTDEAKGSFGGNEYSNLFSIDIPKSSSNSESLTEDFKREIDAAFI